MSTTYTGDGTGLAPATDAVAITAPADGDNLTAASNNVGANKLADWVDAIRDAAGFINVARTWTTTQIFSVVQQFSQGLLARAAADDAAPIKTDQTATGAHWKLLWEMGATTKKLRFYFDANMGFCMTINAVWSVAGTQWAQDTAAFAYRVHFSSGGDLKLQSKSAATWAEADWTWSKAFSTDTVSLHTVSALFSDINLDSDVDITLSLDVGTRTTGQDFKATSSPVATAGPGANVMTAPQIQKAFAQFEITGGNGAGNFTITSRDGSNVTLSRQSASVFRIAFTTAMANNFPAAAVSCTENSSDSRAHLNVVARGSGAMDFSIQRSNAAGAVDLDALANTVTFFCDVSVSGRQ